MALLLADKEVVSHTKNYVTSALLTMMLVGIVLGVITWRWR